MIHILGCRNFGQVVELLLYEFWNEMVAGYGMVLQHLFSVDLDDLYIHLLFYPTSFHQIPEEFRAVFQLKH